MEALGITVTAWEAALAAGEKAPAAPVPPTPDDYCTIMYTSGTTGGRLAAWQGKPAARQWSSVPALGRARGSRAELQFNAASSCLVPLPPAPHTPLSKAHAAPAHTTPALQATPKACC